MPSFSAVRAAELGALGVRPGDSSRSHGLSWENVSVRETDSSVALAAYTDPSSNSCFCCVERGKYSRRAPGYWQHKVPSQYSMVVSCDLTRDGNVLVLLYGTWLSYGHNRRAA